ncbi:MAG: LCP family protein [Oscillospiraceae bacterium]|nr:LCP family protein [Oscillospiraceae bacterium]
MSHHNGMSDTQPIHVPDETIIYTPPASVTAPPPQPDAPATKTTPTTHTTPQRVKPKVPVKTTRTTPPPPNLPDQKKKKKKKKKKQPFGCCLGQTIFYIVLIVFLLYSGCSLLAITRMQHDEPKPRAMSTAAVYSDKNVRNILVIGSDSREGEQGRADSMIVLSVSRLNHTITMTSIMRDSYVSIPGHGPDKLNAAFAYGGPTLLMDTIQNNFCIEIDDYVCISFQSVVAVTDALGGVEVTLSDREAEAVNQILHDEVNRLMGDEQDADYLPCGGTYVLNGKQALSYSRIRYVGNADFERTERQRTVLTGLMQRVKHFSPSAIPSLLMDAVPTISTNMGTGELYLWSLELPYLLISHDLQTLRLPADGTYSDQTTSGGAMVLAVDFDANLTAFKEAVQTDKLKAENEDVPNE